MSNTKTATPNRETCGNSMPSHSTAAHQAGISAPLANRCRLLVSVRDLEEAKLAFAYNVDWIDLKDPSQGPLGAPSIELADAIANFLDAETTRGDAESPSATFGNSKRSAALGELRNLEMERAIAVASRFPVVKVGLSGLQGEAWERQLAELANQLPKHSSLVPVHYADWRSCGGLGLDDVIRAAELVNAGRILIDTYAKTGKSLLNFYTMPELKCLAERVEKEDFSLVIAGSLREEHMASLSSLPIEAIGVRGAVCGGSRDESISESKLLRWVQMFGDYRPKNP